MYVSHNSLHFRREYLNNKLLLLVHVDTVNIHLCLTSTHYGWVSLKAGGRSGARTQYHSLCCQAYCRLTYPLTYIPRRFIEIIRYMNRMFQPRTFRLCIDGAHYLLSSLASLFFFLLRFIGL